VTPHPPRILDASALVTLFDGNPIMLDMLDEAEAGNVVLLMPPLAMAQAETKLRAGLRLWEPLLLFRGVHSMDLTEHVAIEIGGMLTPRPGGAAVPTRPAVGHVVFEAEAVNAVVVTRAPQVYAGHDVDLIAV
jgi:hypothetical protein